MRGSRREVWTDAVHVYPTDDVRDHVTDFREGGVCWCNYRVEAVKDAATLGAPDTMVIHEKAS